MDLDRDGVGVHYDVAGTGPAVLLSHGFGASSEMFQPNVAALATDHTVITWDQRGHGRSDAPADPAAYSPALAVADMAAILDAVGAERAVIGGHSLGGYLSLAFHLAHPERTAALLLIDTGPGYRSDEGRAKWNGMAEGLAAELDERGLTGRALAARHVLTQADARVLDSLPAVAVPVLIVVGELDKPFLKGSRYMAGKIPGADLVVIPGAGHDPNVTHAADFDAHVRTFLDRLEVPR